MTESVYGPLVDQWDVETAVLATFREWLPEYLAEVERQKGLGNGSLGRPPAPECYYGGLDFETERQFNLPAVIVAVKPSGLERREELYTAAYTVEVACVVEGVDENEARMRAARFGAASMLLVQQETLGELGTLAERVVMIEQPHVEFPDPEMRRLTRSVTSFTVWVTPIVNPDGGPLAPSEPAEQPAAPWPEVTDVEVTVEADPINPE